LYPYLKHGNIVLGLTLLITLDCYNKVSPFNRFESKGTQWLKSRPTHPIGLAPEDVAKMELAKKAASDPAPAPQVHVSKAAKKNAKRKEKKKQEQAGGGAPQTSHSQVTKAMEQVSISRPADSAGGKDNSEAKPDLAKKLKNLKKKLKQIEDLENKIKSGELKNPEKDQLEKVSKKQAVMDEIEDIELELEES